MRQKYPMVDDEWYWKNEEQALNNCISYKHLSRSAYGVSGRAMLFVYIVLK